MKDYPGQETKGSRKRILITGSCGLIGRIIWETLETEFDLWGIDIRAEDSERESCVDIRDNKAFSNLMKKLPPVDCIVHLAAVSSLNASWDLALETNILGTKNIYEAARAWGVRRVILASTVHINKGEVNSKLLTPWSCALGRIKTSGMVSPESNYGLSKLYCENLANQYFDSYGLSSVCLRLGWVAKQEQAVPNHSSYRIWLSFRDLVQLIRKSVLADVGCGVYFGVSANSPGLLDLTDARRDLGYRPVDGLSLLADHKRVLWFIQRVVAATARKLSGDRYPLWRDRMVSRIQGN